MHDRLTVFALGLALPAMFTPSAVSAPNDTFVYETIYGWTVRTDRARNYNCFAEAVYDDGTIVRIGVDPNGAGSNFLFSDPNWEAIEPGSQHSIVMQFDAMPVWNLVATGLSVDSEFALAAVRIEIPPTQRSAIVEQFMHASAVELSLGEFAPVTLSLSGSRRATETAAECQIAMARLRAPSTDDDKIDAETDSSN